MGRDEMKALSSVVTEYCQGNGFHMGFCISHFLIAVPNYLIQGTLKKGFILFMVPEYNPS